MNCAVLMGGDGIARSRDIQVEPVSLGVTRRTTTSSENFAAGPACSAHDQLRFFAKMATSHTSRCQRPPDVR